MAFFMELGIGDTLAIGNGTRIVLERKTGQRARLRIESDQDVERFKPGEKVVPPSRPDSRVEDATAVSSLSQKPYLQRPKS